MKLTEYGISLVTAWTNFGPSQVISPKYHADFEVCAHYLCIFKTAIPSMQQSWNNFLKAKNTTKSLLNWKKISFTKPEK